MSVAPDGAHTAIGEPEQELDEFQDFPLKYHSPGMIVCVSCQLVCNGNILGHLKDCHVCPVSGEEQQNLRHRFFQQVVRGRPVIKFEDLPVHTDPVAHYPFLPLIGPAYKCRADPTSCWFINTSKLATQRHAIQQHLEPSPDAVKSIACCQQWVPTRFRHRTSLFEVLGPASQNERDNPSGGSSKDTISNNRQNVSNSSASECSSSDSYFSAGGMYYLGPSQRLLKSKSPPITESSSVAKEDQSYISHDAGTSKLQAEVEHEHMPSIMSEENVHISAPEDVPNSNGIIASNGIDLAQVLHAIQEASKVNAAQMTAIKVANDASMNQLRVAHTAHNSTISELQSQMKQFTKDIIELASETASAQIVARRGATAASIELLSDMHMSTVSQLHKQVDKLTKDVGELRCKVQQIVAGLSDVKHLTTLFKQFMAEHNAERAKVTDAISAMNRRVTLLHQNAQAENNSMLNATKAQMTSLKEQVNSWKEIEDRAQSKASDNITQSHTIVNELKELLTSELRSQLQKRTGNDASVTQLTTQVISLAEAMKSGAVLERQERTTNSTSMNQLSALVAQIKDDITTEREAEMQKTVANEMAMAQLRAQMDTLKEEMKSELRSEMQEILKAVKLSRKRAVTISLGAAGVVEKFRMVGNDSEAESEAPLSSTLRADDSAKQNGSGASIKRPRTKY